MGVLDVTCPECDGAGGACTFCAGDGIVALTGDTYSKGVTSGNAVDVINAVYRAQETMFDDLADKCNDIMDKCNDIFEKVKRIMPEQDIFKNLSDRTEGNN